VNPSGVEAHLEKPTLQSMIVVLEHNPLISFMQMGERPVEQFADVAVQDGQFAIVTFGAHVPNCGLLRNLSLYLSF
jgi:hypothetical protein